MQAPRECVKHKWPYKARYKENSVEGYTCKRCVKGIEKQEGSNILSHWFELTLGKGPLSLFLYYIVYIYIVGQVSNLVNSCLH